MPKLSEELTLPEIAKLLCGKSKSNKADCAKMMLGFLVRVVTPFNPKRISGKHHLIALYKDEPKGFWKKLNGEKRGRPKSNHGADIDNAQKIFVGRDYFLYFINDTPKYRYPRIKEYYKKNPFWGKPENR